MGRTAACVDCWSSIPDNMQVYVFVAPAQIKLSNLQLRKYSHIFFLLSGGCHFLFQLYDFVIIGILYLGNALLYLLQILVLRLVK